MKLFQGKFCSYIILLENTYKCTSINYTVYYTLPWIKPLVGLDKFDILTELKVWVTSLKLTALRRSLNSLADLGIFSVII